MTVFNKFATVGVALASATLISACGSSSPEKAGDASSYPTKPITILVGSAAGSGVDVMARQAAEQLKDRLDTSIAVRNMEGGDGATLMTYLKSKDADGYTIGVNARGQLIALNTSLRDQFSLDDWTYLAEMETDPYVLVVNAKSGMEDFDDFVATAKKGSMSVSGYGANSGQRLVALQINEAKGIETKYVPFGGGSEAVTNLLGDHVDAAVTNAAQVNELVSAGKLTVLAVATEEPSEAFPDSPTFNDLGMPEVTVPHWRGFYVRAETPQPIVDKLLETFSDISEDPAWKKKVTEAGQVPEFSAGDEWQTKVQEDFTNMQPLLKSANLMK